MSEVRVRRAPHKTKFSDAILDVIYDEFHLFTWFPRRDLWLDPMGGVGKLALNWPQRSIVTNDIEYEWVSQAPGMRVRSDVHNLPFRDSSIPFVVTSPTYGNRFSDHHNAKDGSRRNGYAFWLREVGLEPHPNNSGLLKFGPAYKRFHILAYREIRRVLKPLNTEAKDASNGWFVLNVSDFIANKRVVETVDWHITTCKALGFKLIKRIDVETPRHKDGANSDARVESEAVLMWRKVA